MSSQKISETGWFYHAPAKRQEKEAVLAPPASQIPGLSELPDDPNLHNDGKIWIRETDSDYIKLSKMGGRPDLLRQRSPKAASEEAVGYPKVDWFYLDDIMMEDQEKNSYRQTQGSYQFMLPEYMVHQEYQARGGVGGSEQKGKRAPYACEETSVFQREGGRANDKTVKLPEVRQAGYGVRQEKQHGKPVKHFKMPPPQKAKPHQSELEEGKRRVHKMPPANETDPVVMGKLLSYGYGQDWSTDRDTWFKKQQQVSDKFDAATQSKTTSEYQESMGSAHSSKRSSGSATRSASDEARKNKQNNQNTGELFKMSKFKNVPAKTNSHRSRVING